MSLRIETARLKWAEQLLAIYAPYVTDTSITFEYEVPTVETFKERIMTTLERYPYLVALIDDVPVGYAYASCFKIRAAYDWAVETSVYVRQDLHGQGIGKALYEALERVLARQHVTNINACITYPNPVSERFHEAMGYHKAAHFTQCGFKHGQWHDMIWMEKHLCEHPARPEPFIPFPLLIS